MSKQISIIVPVYNGEKHLVRCIESILNQEFDRRHLEILLINDGSSDGSLRLLKGYQKKNPTVISVVDQKNAGAATARNNGIQQARGEYVLFIDQDDSVDSDYCRCLYEAITEGDYDVVQAGFKKVNNAGVVIQTILPIATEFGKFLSIPAWTKIHKTQFLRDYKINFFDNNIGEDNVFTAKEVISTKKYKFLNYAGYNNSFDNSISVTNTLHRGLSPDVKFVRLLDELSLVRSDDSNTNAMLQYNIIRTSSYYLLSYGRSASQERFMEVYREIFGWFENADNHYFNNKYLFNKPSGEAMSAYLGTTGLVLLHKLRLMGIFAKVYCKY